jgi:cell division protein FtsQ
MTNEGAMTVSSSSAGRFARRVRARRWSRLRVLLVVVLLTAAGGLVAWVLLASSLFGVSSVRVEGTGRVSPAQVRGVAGIQSGTPLARLDTAAVAARVAALPAVRTVDVRRTWPRGVAIVVRERVPAAVRVRGTGFALVDRSGVVFAEVARRPKGLPLVTAPIGAGAPALRAALDVLDSVPLPVRGQVRTVRAANEQDVRLSLTRGRTVLWGTPERGSRKGAVLAVLLSRKATVYDVSAPDAPTTRK